jgi:hypothetical protein
MNSKHSSLGVVLGWDPGSTFIDGGKNYLERKKYQDQDQEKIENQIIHREAIFYFCVCVSETPQKRMSHLRNNSNGPFGLWNL